MSSSDNITLGPARIGDAPTIANMSRALIELGLPWSWTPKRVAGHMRQRENMVVIAKGDGQLVGFVIAQFGAERVHLTLLGVAKEHQRRGIGRRLVQWVEESAAVAGLFTVTLEVRASNQLARRFYERLGYRESGVSAGYYSGVEDAIKLTRDLSKRMADSS
jgi:ribosomal-protein-alanine acetyltransferase